MIQLTQVHATDIEFLKFIERIYTESFPPDERRDFSDVIRLLEENDDFFIVLLSDENKAVGFISYWEWNDFSYVEHFAVDSSCRGSGYGATAMTELLKRINNPAVLEVEKPLDDISQRRIRFYERLGFVLFMVIVRCHCIGTIHIHITPILQISKTTAYNHYYTDYQTDKPPFFHLLAPLYPCIIIQVYDSTAYFSIQLYL